MPTSPPLVTQQVLTPARVGIALTALLVGVARAAVASENPKPPADDADEAKRPQVSVDGTQLGPTTWAEARVEVPVTKTVSLFPEGALLRVGGDQPTLNPYFGGGAAWEPDDTWHFELSALYGPSAYDIESLAGYLGVNKELGGDPANDVPPVVELETELVVKHVSWADGLGPAGSDIVQSYFEAKALWHATSRLEITPRAMGFLYNYQLYQAVGDRLGSVMVLARVGTFAPEALGGLRVGYSFVRWLTPFVEGDGILYTAGVGAATELLGGTRVRFTKWLTMSLGGGAVINSVSGPLVPPGTDTVLPIARTEIDVTM